MLTTPLDSTDAILEGTIRVIVADDHPIVRTGLRVLLGTTPDIEVVGEAADGVEALEIIERVAPHVAVLDIDMPRMDGLEATRALVASGSPTRALIVTMHVEAGYRDKLIDAGACGYLTKNAADRELPRAVRTVAAGRVYTQLDPLRAFDPGPQPHALPTQREQYERLSMRERTVLRLVAEGWSTTEIGDKLLVSPKTAQTYRERIGQKLGFAHRSDYLRLCLGLGLLHPNARRD